MLAQSSSDLLFQTQEEGIGMSNSNPDLIDPKELVEGRFKQSHESNAGSLEKLDNAEIKPSETNVLDDLELFIHEKADIALNEGITFEDRMRLATSPPVVQSSQNSNT